MLKDLLRNWWCQNNHRCWSIKAWKCKNEKKLMTSEKTMRSLRHDECLVKLWSGWPNNGSYILNDGCIVLWSKAPLLVFNGNWRSHRLSSHRESMSRVNLMTNDWSSMGQIFNQYNKDELSIAGQKYDV